MGQFRDIDVFGEDILFKEGTLHGINPYKKHTNLKKNDFMFCNRTQELFNIYQKIK